VSKHLSRCELLRLAPGARSARRRHLARRLHAAGVRPTLECLLDVALDEALEDFGRLPPEVYRSVGADDFSPSLILVKADCRQYRAGGFERAVNMNPNMETKMPDYSDRFGGKFMNAKHVTTPIVGVVSFVKLEECGRSEKPKPVLYLADVERGIVLNFARYNFMTELTGSADTDDWKGVEVEVRQGETSYGGQSVPCIELANPRKKRKKLAAADLNDEVPF
jgi:hypothetical protein